MAQQDQAFGKYKMLARLAQEPTAEVFKALNTQTNHTVVLRLIHAAVSTHPQVARLFEEHGEIERYQVEHPNLLSLVDFGEVGTRRFFCVEFVEGKSLARRLKDGKVPVEEAMDILRQVAEGLRALHQRRLYHGDVKPANILLTTDRRGRLLVKLSLVDLSVTSAEAMVSIFGELVGTPKYLSPEQIMGERPSVQSDIFALGVVAYEMLSGQAPFHAENPLGYLHKNVHEKEKPLRELDAKIPIEFNLIVHKMMAKSPQERYRSCQNLLDDLDRAERSIMGGYVARLEPGIDSAFAPRPTPPAEEVAQPEALSKRKVAGVALAVVGIGLLILASMTLGRRLFWPQEKRETGPLAETTPAERRDDRREREAYSRLLKARDAESKGKIKDARKEYETLASRYAGTTSAQDAEAKLAELSKRGGAAQPSKKPGPAAQPPIEAPTTAASPELQKAYDAIHEEAKRLVARHEYALAAKKYSGFAEAYEGTPEAELAKEQLPSVLFSWAETLSLGGQDEQAIAKYLEIQQKYKDSEWAERARRAVPSVALQHARRLERNQDYEGASEAYRNLAENYQETEAGQTAAKKLPEAMLAAAKKCLERNETEKGVKLLEDVAAKYSMAPAGEAASKLLPEILLQRAEAFTAGGKAAEADAALREIIEKFSSSDAAAKARDRRAELLYAGSQELIKAGKTKEGIAKFDELARAFPESPLVAQHQSEMNGLRAQLASAEPGGAAAKPAPELLYQTAMNLMAQGQKDEALTKLETLVRDFPNAPVAAKARETLAKTLYEEAEQLKAQGRPKESAELMEELTKQFPESEWAQKAKDEKARLAGIPEGMILMAGGPFNMGSEETEIRAFVAGEEEADAQTMKGAMMCETPKHEVNAPAFYIDRTEVTNAQYLKFVEETGRTPPAHWVRGKPLPGKEDHPVVYVNWEDAEAYAKWAGKRLPTEAEWEFAARGTDGRAYPWGRKFDSSKCNFMNPKVKATMPVGSFPDGASPSGCLDMVGNAAEWTAGGFEQYPGNRAPQPEYGQKLRVVRGGAWNDTLAVYGRCASRRPMEPGLKERGLGFRCAKDAK